MKTFDQGKGRVIKTRPQPQTLMMRSMNRQERSRQDLIDDKKCSAYLTTAFARSIDRRVEPVSLVIRVESNASRCCKPRSINTRNGISLPSCRRWGKYVVQVMEWFATESEQGQCPVTPANGGPPRP